MDNNTKLEVYKYIEEALLHLDEAVEILKSANTYTPEQEAHKKDMLLRAGALQNKIDKLMEKTSK